MHKDPSLLEQDIKETLAKGEVYQQPEITFTLHYENGDYDIPDPMFLSITRDFNNNMFDIINVKFSIPAGLYRDNILANKDRLELTITIKYKNGYHDRDKYLTGIYLSKKYEGGHVVRRRYKLIIEDPESKYNNPKYKSLTTDDLNRMEMAVVKGQCLPVLPLILKPYYTSCIHWNINIEKFIKAYMGNTLNKIEFLGRPLKYKLVLYPPDNETIYDHIVIKQGTKFIKIPFYLQETDYGVYNHDLNLYIHESGDPDNTQWIYIYPKYSFEDYETTIFNKIVLLSSSKVNAGNNEITYYTPPNTVEYRIIPQDVKVKRHGQHNIAKAYDGLYKNNPYSIFNEDLKTVTDDKVIIDTELVSQIDTWNINKTGIANLLGTQSDVNLYKYRSFLSSLNKDIITVSFNHIDDRIFKPGMNILYSYVLGDRVINKRGIVQSFSIDYNIKAKKSAAILVAAIEPIKEGE